MTPLQLGDPQLNTQFRGPASYSNNEITSHSHGMKFWGLLPVLGLLTLRQGQLDPTVSGMKVKKRPEAALEL